MPAVLIPSDGGEQVSLDKPILVVGRNPDCDIVLHDSRKVSRKHCCLAFVNDRYLVRDLNSMNGVRINGEQIEREQFLELGDELQVGDVTFTLMDSNRRRNAPVRPQQASAPKPAPKSERVDPVTPSPNADLDADKLDPENTETPVAPVPDIYSQEIPVAIPEENQDADFDFKSFDEQDEEEGGPTRGQEYLPISDPSESSDSFDDADSQVEMAY